MNGYSDIGLLSGAVGGAEGIVDGVLRNYEVTANVTLGPVLPSTIYEGVLLMGGLIGHFARWSERVVEPTFFVSLGLLASKGSEWASHKVGIGGGPIAMSGVARPPLAHLAATGGGQRVAGQVAHRTQHPGVLA